METNEDPRPLWSDAFEVEFHECDARGQFDLAALANRMQVTAWRHFWHIDERRGPLLGPGQAWIMIRMELRIQRPLHCRDQVLLETWPRGIEGITALREFRLLGPDGEAAMLATTSWVVLDIETARVQRLRDQTAKWPTLPERSFLGKTAEKLPPPADPVFDAPFPVRYRDLDANRHVNHVRYIEWTLDRLPAQLLRERAIRSFEINFFEEARCDEAVEAGLSAPSDSEFLLSLRRCDDKKEVCRSRIAFGER